MHMHRARGSQFFRLNHLHLAIPRGVRRLAAAFVSPSGSIASVKQPLHQGATKENSGEPTYSKIVLGLEASRAYAIRLNGRFVTDRVRAVLSKVRLALQVGSRASRL